MQRKVKSITVKVAGKEATRKTWTHTWKTFVEVFLGVLAGGIADVFARDYGSPAFRLALFALIAVSVSSGVTAALNEDQRLTRTMKTFIQAFAGVFTGGIAAVIVDYGTPAFKMGLISLITVAISTALAAVMNLQPSEVIQGDKGAEDSE